jgi:hypothetical protein
MPRANTSYGSALHEESQEYGESGRMEVCDVVFLQTVP